MPASTTDDIDLSAGLKPKKATTKPPVKAPHVPPTSTDDVDLSAGLKAKAVSPPSVPATAPSAPKIPLSTEITQGAHRLISSFDASFGLGEEIQSHPSDLVKGIYQAFRHPKLEIDSLKEMYKGMSEAQQRVIDRAYNLQHSSNIADKADGFAMGVAAAIPMLGPGFVAAADQWQGGDKWGATGTLAGLGMQVLAPDGEEHPEIVKTGTETHLAIDPYKAASEAQMRETALAGSKARPYYRLKGNVIARTKERGRVAIQDLLGVGPRMAGKAGEELQTKKGELAKDYTEAVQAHGIATDLERLQHVSEEERAKTEYATSKSTEQTQHEKVQAEARTKHDTEHAHKVEEIKAENERVLELVKHRRDLEQHRNTAQSDLSSRINAAETTANADEKAAWNAVRDKISKSGGTDTVSGNGLIDAIRDAEKNKLKGTSPEAIRTFRAIVRQIQSKLEELTEAEGKASVEAGAVPKPSHKLVEKFKKEIENLTTSSEVGGILPAGIKPEDLLPKESKPDVEIPFDQLHGWVSELGHEAANRPYGEPSDVEAAITHVWKAARKMMDDVAEKNGAKADLELARKASRDKHEAFSRELREPLSAADKYKRTHAKEQYDAEIETRREAGLKKFDPEIVSIKNKINGLDSELERIGTEKYLMGRFQQPPTETPFVSEPYKPPTPSVPKEFKPQPPPVEKVITDKDVTDVIGDRETRIRDKEAKIKEGRAWDIIKLASIPIGLTAGLVGGARAGVETFGAYLGGAIALKNMMMNRLGRQEFIDWLKRPSVQELNATMHLDPAIRDLLHDRIKMFVDAEKKLRNVKVYVNPLLEKVLTAKQAKTGTAVVSSAGRATGGIIPQPPKTGESREELSEQDMKELNKSVEEVTAQ